MTVPRGGRDGAGIETEDVRSLSTIYAENPAYQNQESPYVGAATLNDKIHVQICDVTNMATDAIACSCQTNLALEPFGMCRNVLMAGGPELENACHDVAHCDPGKAFMTPGYSLPAKYVVFTAGPPPGTTLSYTERSQCLRQSYLSCLQFVRDVADIRSVAFPCIGAGGAGIELSTAISTAVRAIREWLTTADNDTQVDAIILCIYDEYQWSKYCPVLFKLFPFPKDIPRLQHGASVFEEGIGATTNILCYKYQKCSAVTEAVDQRFGKLVETFRQTLSCPKTQVTTHDNVVRLELKKMGHFLHLRHSVNRAMLEFQIFNVSPGAEAVDVITCSETQAVIEDFLVANFDNLTTMTVFVRCEYSSMGERRGLWKLRKLLESAGEDQRNQTCTQHLLKGNFHAIDVADMLLYWRFSKMANMDSDGSLSHCYQDQQRSLDENSLHGTMNPLPLPSVTCSTGAGRLTRPPNIAIAPRDVDQGSWRSSTETSSSMSEHTGDSESGAPDMPKRGRKHRDCSCQQATTPSQSTSGNTAVSESGAPDMTTRVGISRAPLSDPPKQCECSCQQATTPTQSTSGIGGAIRRGVQKLRKLTRSSSSSSANETESSQSSQSGRGSGSRSDGSQQSATSGQDAACQTPPAMGAARNPLNEFSDTVPERLCLRNTSNARSPTIQTNNFDWSNECSCNRKKPFDTRKYMHDTDDDNSSDTSMTNLKQAQCNEYDYMKGGGVQSKDHLVSQDTNDLSDQRLLKVSRHIGNRHKELGIELGLRECEIQVCWQRAEGNANMFGLHILKKWRSRGGDSCTLDTLLAAMDTCDIDTYHLRNNV